MQPRNLSKDLQSQNQNPNLHQLKPKPCIHSQLCQFSLCFPQVMVEGRNFHQGLPNPIQDLNPEFQKSKLCTHPQPYLHIVCQCLLKSQEGRPCQQSPSWVLILSLCQRLFQFSTSKVSKLPTHSAKPSRKLQHQEGNL